MAKIGVTETVLRDAHQSLIATRMRTDEFEGILEKMDNIGYHSLECWGGATFDSCLRFLDEDPWERLRLIRRKCPKTKLQMLFRGQNMLGYRHYADDLVDYFVKKSIDNGIDILRIFDALNDVRNLETAINAAKKYGGHVQAAISYTTGPVLMRLIIATMQSSLRMQARIQFALRIWQACSLLTALTILLRLLKKRLKFLFSFILTTPQVLPQWFTSRVLRPALML